MKDIHIHTTKPPGSEAGSPLPTSDDGSLSEERVSTERGQGGFMLSPLEHHSNNSDDALTSEDDSYGATPSILSESTKPDPPSIIGNSIVEEEEVEDRRLAEERYQRDLLPPRDNESSTGEISESLNKEELSREPSGLLSLNEIAETENVAEVLVSLSSETATSKDTISGDQHPVGSNQAIADQKAPLDWGNSSQGVLFDAPVNTLSKEQQQREPPSIIGHDDVVLLPRVDEHRPPRELHAFLPQTLGQQSSYGGSYTNPMMMQQSMHLQLNGGRRKIKLRLQEDVRSKVRRGIIGHFRRMSMSDRGELEFKSVDRGIINVSWFDGTSSLELQQHVRKSVVRKLHLESPIELDDFRILDETTSPPEEIVLSPYIPDGAQFLLRFSTKDTSTDGTVTPGSMYSGRAPDSPSAAPSSHHNREILAGLNANQLALLGNYKMPSRGESDRQERNGALRKPKSNDRKSGSSSNSNNKGSNPLALPDVPGNSTTQNEEEDDIQSTAFTDIDEADEALRLSQDPVEARLRQITELLIEDRSKKSRSIERRQEKRQVIFVLANYFVLFLSLIAISAEIQARAPTWLSDMEKQMKNVRDCAANQDALFECVSNGDFAGLIASVILWLSRSVATRRIFLFGFETPNKLWTVVYESLVTAACWGFSYMFIRRGLNPDTRKNFLHRYWKDAVYGSLAGFNAAFMKHVLKNLIPQEAVEDALRDRQLKILSWLPSFA